MRMPNGRARRASSVPLAPSPTMPRVMPTSSLPRGMKNGPCEKFTWASR